MAVRAEQAGWSVTGALAGTLAVVCAAGLALHLTDATEIDAASLALGAAAAALLCVLLVHRQVRRSHLQHEKISEEFDALAQALMRVEAGLAALDGSGTKAKSTLNDVAGDVHSLSQVVRSLAEALATQERELAALKRDGVQLSYRTTLPPPIPAAASPEAPSVVPSFIPAQEAAQAALSESLRETAKRRLPTDGSAAILAAAALGEIDLHVQPVVNLPQRRDRIYEGYPLLRSAEAEPLLPREYMPVLLSAGRVADFQAGIVGRALTLVHRLAEAAIDARVSVPVSPAALAQDAFMRRIEALLDDNQPAGGRLVLEIEQAALDIVARSDAFPRLRHAGVGFALTKVTDENLNPPALARLGIRYVRLDAGRILTGLERDGLAADIVTLTGALSRAGIEVIADEIEDDGLIPELLDIGIPLAQGLGLSLPMPADAVLEQPRRGTQNPKPVPATPPEAPKPDGSGPPQGSLRDFLRRAG